MISSGDFDSIDETVTVSGIKKDDILNINVREGFKNDSYINVKEK